MRQRTTTKKPFSVVLPLDVDLDQIAEKMQITKGEVLRRSLKAYVQANFHQDLGNVA